MVYVFVLKMRGLSMVPNMKMVERDVHYAIPIWFTLILDVHVVMLF